MNRSIHVLQVNYPSVKETMCHFLLVACFPSALCCQNLSALHILLNTIVYLKNLKSSHITYVSLLFVSFKNYTGSDLA